MECQTVYLNVADMKSLPQSVAAGSWSQAVRLLERWLQRHERVDALLAEAPAGRRPADGAEMAAIARDRARCQHLLFGAIRHLGRLNAAIDARVPRPPRARLRAVLLVAGVELLEADWAPDGMEQAAKIVHHAVAQTKALLSPSEARLVNAVLRKLVGGDELRAPAPPGDAGAPELARHFSHPEWLVRRWLRHFGPTATLSLLAWDQTPPPVYARWRSVENPPPAWLQSTSWPGFHLVPAGRWSEVEPLLAAGALYLQDPSTYAAGALLDPQAGEDVLDLCAAPGGKSLLLADLLEQKTPLGSADDGAAAGPPSGAPAEAGRVVAVDLPDARRIGRLKENLGRVRRTGVALVQADVLELTPARLQAQGLPAAFPAVLLDAPCSNTGVMRHRVDVKWRLCESDVARHAVQQGALLAAASRLVASGGRLVYSTCSLEPEENEQVVDAWLRDAGGRFALAGARSSRPWESGCDGGSAFLLRRTA
jgi:16S rRNA (cytosine967-C5)-methyltransferase